MLPVSERILQSSKVLRKIKEYSEELDTAISTKLHGSYQIELS